MISDIEIQGIVGNGPSHSILVADASGDEAYFRPPSEMVRGVATVAPLSVQFGLGTRIYNCLIDLHLKFLHCAFFPQIQTVSTFL